MYGVAELEDVFPVVVFFAVVGGGEDEEDVSGVLEGQQLLLVVDDDSQRCLVEEGPSLGDEALVDEVQVVEGDCAGQQGEHPGQTDDAEV